MEEEASLLRDPTIVFMTALLADVKKGTIQLPRFQRGGVWTLQQRLDLLDSVYRAIPIGAIMLWRTDTRLNTRTKVGPHRVPPDGEAGPHQYILDGGQRIATLLGALYAVEGAVVPREDSPDPGEDEEPFDAGFDLFFDLEEQAFVPRELGVSPPQHWLPLPDALQTVRLLKFQRALKGSEDEIETWIARADGLSTRLRGYKVPVISLVSENLELATTTFKRVNSTGTPMSESDMVSALTWSATFDLQAEIEQHREESLRPLGWQGLDDEAWLRCIKAVLRLDLYASVDRVRHVLREEPGAVERTSWSLGYVAAFLRDDCGIASPALVPYAHQIPLLAMAFDGPTPPAVALRKKLQGWLWLTTYAELFAGISGNGLSRTQGGVEALLSTGELSWPGRRPFQHRQLPKRFDFRHARARAMALRLASEASDGAAMLAKSGAEAMLRLVVRGAGKESPGNRFFAPGMSRADLQAELTANEDTRRRHHVSEPAWALFVAKDTAGFALLRAQELDSMEQEFVSQWTSLLARDSLSPVEGEGRRLIELGEQWSQLGPFDPSRPSLALRRPNGAWSVGNDLLAAERTWRGDLAYEGSDSAPLFRGTPGDLAALGVQVVEGDHGVFQGQDGWVSVDLQLVDLRAVPRR